MKVYVVLFEFEGERSLEGVFATPKDAKNYIFNQALERGLHIPNEIWYEEKEIQTGIKRCSNEDVKALMEGWGCEGSEDQKDFLGKLNIEVEAL